MIGSVTSPVLMVRPIRNGRTQPAGRPRLRSGALPATWLVVAVLAGCGGPQSHPVTGTVTLDGEPVADAIVSFVPQTDQGTWASGQTDQRGRFALRQGAGGNGTTAGEYAVRITTYREGNDDVDPPLPAVPERVPRRYNTASELRVEVGPEQGAFEFDLRTQGEPVVRVEPALASAVSAAAPPSGHREEAASRKSRTVWYLVTILIWLLVLAACYAWWRHNERQWRAARKQPSY